MNKTIVDLYYGSNDVKIHLSIDDEKSLREIIADRIRWTRATPLGKESFEPVLDKIERVNPNECIVSPGPYVGKVELDESVIFFHPPKWLSGLSISHIIFMFLKAKEADPKATYLTEFLTTNTTDISDLTEPLYSFFISELDTALNKGIYRSYITKKIVSPQFKGRLDFTNQLKLNISSKAEFATHQQMFSGDNDVNKLLYLANEIVINKSLIDKTIISALQLKRKLPKVTSNTSINTHNINLSRRGNHFKSSLEIAKLIISGHSVSFSGDLTHSFSMVINLFDLFEKYITNELLLRNKKYNPTFQLMFNDSQLPPSSWARRKVYPDIIYSTTNKLIVADIKLKQLNKSGPRLDDVHQIFFYSKMLNLNYGFLIYPLDSDVEETYVFPLIHEGVNPLTIIAYGIPVTIPISDLPNEIDKLNDFLLKHP